ncbi:UNVERIFIED_CONTAM: hypothetical protein RMT77_018874 [Armadillidium vulgare]
MKIQVLFIFLVASKDQLLALIEIAAKVPNFLPRDVSACQLAEYTMGKEDLLAGCLILCQKHARCLLACTSGRICRLYDATVSRFYSKYVNVSEELSSSRCLSLWDDKLDIASTAVYTKSSVYKDKFGPENAALGFSCPTMSTSYCFHSGYDPKPYLLADFGGPVKVKKVIIQVRGPNYWGLHFRNVEVCVGNSSEVGGNDLSLVKNKLLMYFNDDPVAGQIVTFEGPQPIIGRYLSVQSQSESYLVILEMKVIRVP